MPHSDQVHRSTVFIVDDDAAVRDSVALLLSLRGYSTAVFASAESFLRVVRPDWRGCLLADIRMEGMNGLQMQATLREWDITLPVIIVTGHGDIESARQAFKAAAVDFLEKPFDEGRLLAAIEAALARCSDRCFEPDRGRLSTLSTREREVKELLIEGLNNASIGLALGISPRTVEVHKSRLMSKLGVRTLAELVKNAIGRRDS